jgi:hypothetical protein
MTLFLETMASKGSFPISKMKKKLAWPPLLNIEHGTQTGPWMKHWKVLQNICGFYINQKSKMATIPLLDKV